MTVSPPSKPLRYDPSVEVPEPDEADTAEALAETMLSISRTTYEDGGHGLRSVHAKSHGLLAGRLEVPADLPPVLAQGLFAQPARHRVILRLSTTPGDILPDSVSTPRGMAIKVLDVRGERLPDAPDQSSQDFVLVNGPVFSAPSAKAFLASLKPLAATTDRVPRLKKAVSATLRGVETVVEAFGGDSATIKAMGGEPERHILGESFFSQVPIRYGDYIAKLSVVPVSPELTALTGAPLDVNGKPDGLREAVVAFFRRHGGVWELRVQLCTDLERMPVEDASARWPEELSPYVPVGRIVVEPQVAWSPDRSRAGDDRLSFSPWHCLAAHRPLGSIMRMRRSVYERSARFRAERNGCPIQEPDGSFQLPS